jgi:hypothetical protein
MIHTSSDAAVYQVIEQERRSWLPFRRASSKEDREAFDRMCAEAAQQLQAAVYLRRPWRFETLIMAIFMAHEKRIEQVRMRLAARRIDGRRTRQER